VGELATGRWGMEKFRVYLWYKEFTWITYCSGITKFYDMELMPTHQVQRWKLDMLRYNFKTVHRTERMLCECNLLTRYNLYADELRQSEVTQVIANDHRTKDDG
jgi:hypothetical protein